MLLLRDGYESNRKEFVMNNSDDTAFAALMLIFVVVIVTIAVVIFATPAKMNTINSDDYCAGAVDGNFLVLYNDNSWACVRELPE